MHLPTDVQKCMVIHPQVYTYCMLDGCTSQLASADLVCAIYISFVFEGSLAVCPVLLVLPAIDHCQSVLFSVLEDFPRSVLATTSLSERMTLK